MRILPDTSGDDVFAVVADIVPRRRVVSRRDHCAPPQGATEPGACLAIANAKGSMSACFTLGEIEGGGAYLDTDGRIIGFAPDIARKASAEGTTVTVQDNLFTLPGGPETRVEFRE